MARRETSTGGRDATKGVIPGKFGLSVGMPNTAAPPGFSWTRLTDIARLESGHTPSRSNSSYWNGDIPWVGIRDATGNHGNTICSTAQYITEQGLENSSARLLPVGTVCLSRTASVGYVVTIGVPMTTSQDFVNWVCGPQLAPYYLHYLLMAEQESIRRFAHGTTHQTMYYPEAKALHVCVPGRPEQDAIVEVLRALDEKIAANAKLTSTAEHLTDTKFRLLMSSAIETLNVGSILTLEYGKSLPGSCRTAGAVEVFGSGGVVGEHSEALLDGPGVIVGRKGTSGAVHWAAGPYYPIDTTFYVVPISESIPLIFCYFLLRSLRLREMNSDSAVPGLNRNEVHAALVILPEVDAIRTFATNVSMLFENIAQLKRESRTLAVIRDALLPQLMSGTIRVKDAEKTVEEVL